jgi:hypothetical protein
VFHSNRRGTRRTQDPSVPLVRWLKTRTRFMAAEMTISKPPTYAFFLNVNDALFMQ